MEKTMEQIQIDVILNQIAEINARLDPVQNWGVPYKKESECTHCYCKTVLASTAEPAHEQCCNCGNKQISKYNY